MSNPNYIERIRMIRTLKHLAKNFFLFVLYTGSQFTRNPAERGLQWKGKRVSSGLLSGDYTSLSALDYPRLFCCVRIVINSVPFTLRSTLVSMINYMISLHKTMRYDLNMSHICLNTLLRLP